MDNMEIVKFNPTIAELNSLVEKYKWLKINWIDDKVWYEIVKDAQLDLRDKRVIVQKTWKKYREDAIAYQKRVIEEEKKLVSIIESTEEELRNERSRIDEEKEIEKRRKILPERMAELERNWIDCDNEFIVAMDSDEFNRFVISKREEKILEMQKKVEEESKRVELERQNMEREKELEQTRKEAEEKARIETEARMKREQEEKELREKQRLEAEEKAKIEGERIAKEKMEKNKKYKQRLEDNSYNDVEYIILDKNWKKAMYRFISELSI